MTEISYNVDEFFETVFFFWLWTTIEAVALILSEDSQLTSSLLFFKKKNEKQKKPAVPAINLQRHRMKFSWFFGHNTMNVN